MKRINVLVLCTTLFLGGLWVPAAFAERKDHCDDYLCLKMVHNSGKVTFRAHNLNKKAKLSLRLKLKTKNMDSNVKLPLRLVLEPGEKRLLAIVKAKPKKRYQFQYWYHYTFGDLNAKHDDSATYFLPVAPGSVANVSQGCSGSFSHKGTRQFATDITMPIGTPIHAARGGTVVSVKQDSNRGGRSRANEKHANHIYIRHSDGTLGIYFHLKQNGSEVEEGDVVEARQLIGYSGNTGWSTGPHLHFEVAVPNRNMKWQSQKISFDIEKGQISCPANKKIRAKNL